MFRTSVLISCLLLMVALGATGVAFAAVPVTVRNVTCNDGQQYRLAASGDDASCVEVAAGVFECTDPVTNNGSRGGCASGCEWSRYLGSCQLVIDGQIFLTLGSTDLECPDGRVYRVEDANNTCVTIDNRTEAGVAECEIGDGASTIKTARASCASGCEMSRPGTKCQCVKGCGPPEKK